MSSFCLSVVAAVVVVVVALLQVAVVVQGDLLQVQGLSA
jgi:hypothetical protein